jgi:tRNA-modifying protein YgfZ
MTADMALLLDRGVVHASGADVSTLLDSLITTDMARLNDERALHAALLSPQGKILFVFFIVKSGDDYYLDVARNHALALAKRLTFYKLRAHATFVDVSAEMAVVVSAADASQSVPRGLLIFSDPRGSSLGCRIIAPIGRQAELGQLGSSADAYHRRRILAGVPEEELDYALGDTFPHDANFDQTGTVSFTKGCYVGQEVVSRTQNKAVVRKRIVRVRGRNLTTGAEIKHGAGVIGTIGSVSGDTALAMLRLDRANEAAEKREPLLVDGNAIEVDADAMARYRTSAANKAVIDL